jgi:hypothetical protein
VESVGSGSVADGAEADGLMIVGLLPHALAIAGVVCLAGWRGSADDAGQGTNQCQVFRVLYPPNLDAGGGLALAPGCRALGPEGGPA